MKTCKLCIACCSTLFAMTAAYAAIPATDKGLTANPVYEKNCAKCHGKNAEGRHIGGPSLISEKAAAASTEELHKIINNGKGHMPKFAGKLTAAEVDVLVQQIEAMNKK